VVVLVCFRQLNTKKKNEKSSGICQEIIVMQVLDPLVVGACMRVSTGTSNRFKQGLAWQGLAARRVPNPLAMRHQESLWLISLSCSWVELALAKKVVKKPASSMSHQIRGMSDRDRYLAAATKEE